MKMFTKIGLEIHVQLATKSKMFCRCDNDSQSKAPNTVVCPVCLGLPGTLPVANKQAIEWTLKTGLALDCKIPKTAKFDRKHYFYPDLPKGYQISQYDEPFCVGGYLEIDGNKIRLNRIHLEEDAGKLIHKGTESLVDLNRAGTPLMEIVTEPDITTPTQAGEFLRKLAKIVRDVVEVSEASMEKGHLRCDANISVSEVEGSHSAKASRDLGLEPRMSQIIEIKNLNSFKFVEKALTLVEDKLKSEADNWPEKAAKETWGYDSVKNEVFIQRRKEEAADYRYFPDPDLPPIDTTKFNLLELSASIQESEQSKIDSLVADGVVEADAKILVGSKTRMEFYRQVGAHLQSVEKTTLAKAIVHKYFPFEISIKDLEKVAEYKWAVGQLNSAMINKSQFSEAAKKINAGVALSEIASQYLSAQVNDGEIEEIIAKIIAENPAEVVRYKQGETKLFGFFMGKLMAATLGSANPQKLGALLKEKL